jgi:PAS domain S-box-containing protein
MLPDGPPRSADSDAGPGGILPVDRPAFFERVVQTTTDAVVAFAPDGTVLFANDATGRLVGQDPRSLVGASVRELLPARHRAWLGEMLDRYVETGEQTVSWNGMELLVERADGAEVPVSVTLVETVHGDQQVFTAVVRDISGAVDRRSQLERDLAAAEADRESLTEDTAAAADLAAEARSRLADATAHASRDVADRLEAVDATLADLAETVAPDPAVGDAIETETVSLPDIAAAAWGVVTAEDATLNVEGGGTLAADAGGLRSLLAALFEAAVSRGGPGVTVSVGPLADAPGFYVADDGPAPDAVSPSGAAGRVAAEYGWALSARERDAGGVRAEVRLAPDG